VWVVTNDQIRPGSGELTEAFAPRSRRQWDVFDTAVGNDDHRLCRRGGVPNRRERVSVAGRCRPRVSSRGDAELSFTDTEDGDFGVSDCLSGGCECRHSILTGPTRRQAGVVAGVRGRREAGSAVVHQVVVRQRQEIEPGVGEVVRCPRRRGQGRAALLDPLGINRHPSVMSCP